MKLSYDIATWGVLLATASNFPRGALGGGVNEKEEESRQLLRGGDKEGRALQKGAPINIGDEIGPTSICGAVDDRIASNDIRVARLIPGGCTAWLVSEDVYLTAGHCQEPTSDSRLHFIGWNPVNSDPDVSPTAHPQDQYAIDPSTYNEENGGVGADWGVGKLLPNDITGLTAGVAQSAKCDQSWPSSGTGLGCGWFEIGEVPDSAAGNNIRVTGHGTATTMNMWQKTHMGALVDVWDTALKYMPDTTGGNSGSPVIHEETGLAIGIHTHGGCTATGGSNTGTRIDHPALAAKIASLLETTNPPTEPPTEPPVWTPPATDPPPACVEDRGECSFDDECCSGDCGPRGRCRSSGGDGPNRSPTPEPPTLMPTDDGSGCADDPDWSFVRNGQTRDCAWVGMRPRDRCDRGGANLACLLSCGICSGETPVMTPEDAEDENGCGDDESWEYVTHNGVTKGCDFVSREPRTRCSLVGEGARPANWACLDSCGLCGDEHGCGDDESWEYVTRNGYTKGCDFVRRDPEARCGLVGEGARPANWACLESCGICDTQ